MRGGGILWGQLALCCIAGRAQENGSAPGVAAFLVPVPFPNPVSSNTRLQRAFCRRPSVGAQEGGGKDGWMFVDAKGLNKGGGAALNEMELGVIARPFGDRLVVGDERWLEVSKPSEQILVERAHKHALRVAYSVGRGSSSGTFANAQDFVAGTTASLLSIDDVRCQPAGRVSCLVRVLGRVLLKSVKSMNPHVIAVAEVLRDHSPESKDRWLYIESLEGKIVAETEQIQTLKAQIASKSLKAKLDSLESANSAFLASLDDTQYKDLVNRSASAAAGRAPRVPPAQQGTSFLPPDELAMAILDKRRLVSEWLQREPAYAWADAGAQSGGSGRLSEGDRRRLLEAEVLSFLALRVGDADADLLDEAMRQRQVWARMVSALQLLEDSRTRLAALSALSGLVD